MPPIKQLPHDSEDEGDRSVGVCDGRSSFYSKYDNEGRRHQNKNVVVVTNYPSSLLTPPLA